MNSKKLIVLVCVALLALIVSVWLASRQTSSPTEASADLYPGLTEKLNNATAVKIFKAGDELAVELTRQGEAMSDNWVVAQRAGYPADKAKLSRLLLGIAEAQVREEKTSNPESYPSLGVEDVSDQGAKGVRVEVAGLEPALSLIVGKKGPGSESQYVRKAGEPQSWLVDTDVEASSDPKEWLHRPIIDVSADRIQAATITSKSAKPYTASKQSRADASFTLEGIPKGRELSSPSAANGLATALTGLTLADVQPASALTSEPEAKATLRTFDGLVVDVDGWTQDDKHFVALRANYDQSLAERFKVPSVETKDAPAEGAEADGAKNAGTAKQETPPEKSDVSTPDLKAEPVKRDVDEEAKTLNTQVSGWVYEIPKYKYDAIFKPLEQMLTAK